MNQESSNKMAEEKPTGASPPYHDPEANIKHGTIQALVERDLLDERYKITERGLKNRHVQLMAPAFAIQGFQAPIAALATQIITIFLLAYVCIIALSKRAVVNKQQSFGSRFRSKSPPKLANLQNRMIEP